MLKVVCRYILYKPTSTIVWFFFFLTAATFLYNKPKDFDLALTLLRLQYSLHRKKLSFCKDLKDNGKFNSKFHKILI